MINESKRLNVGFVIAGIILGFLLPILMIVAEKHVPTEYYFSDNVLLRNLADILNYVHMISLYMFIGLFICSVVYLKVYVTTVLSLPFIMYFIIQYFRTIFISKAEIDNLAIIVNILIIILIPVLWYVFTRLISLIKMPDGAKVFVSCIPAFIVYNWIYVEDIILSAMGQSDSNIIDLLLAQLVPFAIYFISVLFIYLIVKDFVNPREAKKSQA